MVDYIKISEYVKNVIIDKIANIDDELNIFLHTDLDSKLDILKKIPYKSGFGSCYDRMIRISTLSKFLSFYVDGVDLQSIILLANLSEIHRTTFLVNIAPELKYFLIASFARSSKYSEEICLSITDKNTKLWTIVHLSRLIDDIIMSSLSSCPVQQQEGKVVDIIKILIDYKINLSLNLLLHKNIVLYKRKKNIRQVENEIISLFKIKFEEIFNETPSLIMTATKTFNIYKIYQKHICRVADKNKIEEIEKFITKLDNLTFDNENMLLFLKKKTGDTKNNKDKTINTELRKIYKELKHNLSKNKKDYKNIVEILFNFIEKQTLIKNFIEGGTEDGILNRSGKNVLLKIKKIFKKKLTS